MNYFFIFIVLCFGLMGCSSSGFRAPVSDLTLSNSKKNYLKTQVSPQSRLASKKIADSIRSKTYKVEKGDTLYSIAWKMDLDVETLAKRNNLKSPYIIYVGQLLTLKDRKYNKVKQSARKISSSTGASSALPSATTAKNTPPSPKEDGKVTKQCASQNCVKSSKNKVVLEKTKAYSVNTVKKVVSTEKATNKKISSWSWPTKGKLIKTFSASQAGMKGISIANQRGTGVYAASDGQVVYAGSGLSGYGNLIIIKHNYDYLSAYAHNDKLLVSENEQIKEGQKIAIMGDSGTDSVHLHFEIRYRGKSVDPLRYLEKR